jgi:hypothetical protein
MNKLIVHRQADKIIMQDEATGETAILDSQEQALTNFASWIYAGRLSGSKEVKP